LKAETKKLKKDLLSSRKDNKPSSVDSAAETADSGQLLLVSCEWGNILIHTGPDLNPIRPFCQNVGPLHEFSGINVQKLNMSSVLQLYTVLLLLPDWRYSFLNSAVVCQPESVVLHQVNF